MDLSLDDARKMADNCLGIAAEMTLKPITVAVLDAAGDLKVLLRQDGTACLADFGGSLVYLDGDASCVQHQRRG